MSRTTGSQTPLSDGEEILQKAKKELGSFIRRAKRVRTLHQLMTVIERESQHSEERFTPKQRATLAYHRLAVSGAIKREGQQDPYPHITAMKTSSELEALRYCDDLTPGEWEYVQERLAALREA